MNGTKEIEQEKLIDAMAVWLIENVDPDSLGVCRLSDPIGANVFFTARTIAKLLTGNAEVASPKLAAMILNAKNESQP